MAKVKIPPVLRPRTGGEAEVSAGGSTVGTVGIPSIDILPGDTDGPTVVESPVPSIAVPDGPGNTIVWFPGGAIVTGSTFIF